MQEFFSPKLLAFLATWEGRPDEWDIPSIRVQGFLFKNSGFLRCGRIYIRLDAIRPGPWDLIASLENPEVSASITHFLKRASVTNLI